MSDTPPSIDDLIPGEEGFLYLNPDSEPTGAWLETQATITLLDQMIEEDIPDFKPDN